MICVGGKDEFGRTGMHVSLSRQIGAAACLLVIVIGRE